MNRKSVKPAALMSRRRVNLMRVENQLLRLARIGPNEHHAAVTETHMRDLHRHGHAVHQDDLMAPVELVGFSRRERQRHKGARRIACMFARPLPGIASEGVIAARIPSPRSSSKIRIRVSRSRADLTTFAASIRSSCSFQVPSFGRGCTSRS